MGYKVKSYVGRTRNSVCAAFGGWPRRRARSDAPYLSAIIAFSPVKMPLPFYARILLFSAPMSETNNLRLQTNDLRVREIVRLISPRALKAELPEAAALAQTVATSRERITRILRQEDPRLL